MFRTSGLVVLLLLILSGCGKRETDAERRQREAVDLCSKGTDCLKASKNDEAESVFKQALEIDPSYKTARNALAPIIERRAKVNAAKSQIALFKIPLEIYQRTVGDFPQDLDALRAPPADLSKPEKWDGPYLDADLPLDPWGNPYQYRSPGVHYPKSYDAWTVAPDGTEIGNW